MFWTVLILFIVCFYNGTCESSDFFLAKQYKNGNNFCVTNSSYALSWVDENEKNPEAFFQQSSYYPTSRLDIDNTNFVNSIWTNSLYLFWKHNNGDPILDSRWEALQIYKTEHVDGYKAYLKYDNILNLKQQNFKIPISIRIKYEAHIFLCNGNKPSTSDCYWFMLQGNHGNVTALRKCNKNKIPDQQNVWPQDDCKKHRTNVTHPHQQPHYLSHTRWSHFVISKEDNTLAFFDQHDKTKPLLEWQDTKDPIDVTNLIIHSKVVNGLWKIHDVNFLYTETEAEEVQLQPSITVTDQDSICLSMFLSMCSTCRLKLSLTKNRNVLNDQDYSAKHSSWNEIKFITYNTKAEDKVNLVVSTTSTQTANTFWAISHIRICNPSEVRGIGLTQSGICQLMSPMNPIIYHEDNTLSNKVLNSQCDEYSIGHFCVPCNLIFGNCHQISVCTEERCVCSAGYNGYQCYYNCAGGFYGHGCNNDCGKCYYSNDCNHIDGTCINQAYGCKENYSGAKCNIPPAVTFTEPPKILAVFFTEAKIEVSNFEIRNTQYDSTPTKYTIQYRATHGTDNKWNDTKEEFPFGTPGIFKLQTLAPETVYSVRSVIIANDKQQINLLVPTSNFTTKCTEIEPEDIIIKPSNLTAEVTITKNARYSCKLYTAYLFQENMKQEFLDGTAQFMNLKPFTEYILIIEKNSKQFEKSFKTAEGIPSQINSVSAKSTSTTITLNWTTPRLNGDLKIFIVKYKKLYTEGCRENENNLSEIREEVHTNSITLSDLMPYSAYEVSITAANTKFEGPAYSYKISTQSSNHIYNDEVPQIVNISSSPYAATILLSQILCEKLQGPLNYIVIINCTNEWCTNRVENSKIIDFVIDKVDVKVSSLDPFSDYSLKLKFCRSDTACITRKAEFKTQPIPPGKIIDALIYTKSNSSVSVRWKPPFPPNGILDKYSFKIWYKNGRQKSEKNGTITPTSCKLWPEFHCATIEELRTNKYYEVEISARNQNLETYGEAETLNTTTAIGKSKAPYNLKLSWSLSNSLELQWSHPNETNGDVNFFVISSYLERTLRFNKQLNIVENSYNLTYHDTINASEFVPTTEYIISVFANNGINGEAVQEKILSPPDVPSLEKETEYDSTNDSILITMFPFKPRGQSDNYKLFVFLSETFAKCNFNIGCLEKSRIISCDFSSEFRSHSLTLGANNKQVNNNCNINNITITPATTYNITLILFNTYKNETRYRIYSKMYKTNGDPLPVNNSSLLGLLILLLLIPLIVIAYKRRDKLKAWKNIFVTPQTSASSEILSKNGDTQENHIALSHSTTNNIPIVSQNTKKPTVPMKPPVKKTLSNLHSKPIKITEFEEYVREAIQSGELERQHALFPRGQTKPWTIGALKENKSKNRYNNLLAYDHTRVILEKMDKSESDYINANYIDGFKVKKAYIATQGPKASTLEDFWKMIWQENVLHLANLANIYEGGKKKLEKYWPDINETLHFGDITVQHISQKVFADYEYRVLNVTYEEETRKIDQLHFSSWPDHGVPLYSQSLVPFLQKFLQYPLNSKSPILVHCSAGVGRTGTILLCDICLRMAAREGTIDVLNSLQLLREQRANMVDNIEQYKLAHLVILECLVGLHTSIPCNELEINVQKLLSNGSCTLHMRYLKDTQWQDQAMKTVAILDDEEPLVVKEKNRFENIVPEPQGRLFISRYPPEDDTSSYINAVKVDGFQCPGKFIVTQQPMPNTLSDFWRLIDEYSQSSLTVILSLNEINPRDTSSCKFWPSKNQPIMYPVPYIALKHVNTVSTKLYTVNTVNLCTESKSEPLQVHIYSLKGWTTNEACPKNINEFLSFWEEVDSVARRSNPVFVTCYDGVKASGLYAAMCFIIEKMKLEQVCDVCQAVKNIRHNRPEFIQDLDQFEFLYKAAALYINEFEFYANFN